MTCVSSLSLSLSLSFSLSLSRVWACVCRVATQYRAARPRLPPQMATPVAACPAKIATSKSGPQALRPPLMLRRTPSAAPRHRRDPLTHAAPVRYPPAPFLDLHGSPPGAPEPGPGAAPSCGAGARRALGCMGFRDCRRTGTGSAWAVPFIDGVGTRRCRKTAPCPPPRPTAGGRLWIAPPRVRWAGAGPHHRDQPIRASPPGDGAIRMRQRYHCHTKFPSSSPVWVR